MAPFEIIHGSKVTEKEIEQALRLDRMSYPEDYQLRLDTCVSYHRRNDGIYIMALDRPGDEVVGYINFSPVSGEAYRRMTSGMFTDMTIAPEDIVPYVDGMSCLGYFSSIVVHPDHRKQGIASAMIRRWEEYVCELAETRGVIFTKIVADVLNDAGCHIAKKLGLQRRIVSIYGSTVMEMTLMPLKDRSPGANRAVCACYDKCSGKGE